MGRRRRRLWWETIPENASRAFPSAVVYVDTETLPREGKRRVEHSFRLASAVMVTYRRGEPQRRRGPEVFKSPEDFWKWVDSYLRPKRSIWVVAHSMDFDFSALQGFSYTHSHGWSPVFFAWAWESWLAVLKRGQRTLKFVDSLGIFRESVSALGERISLPKLPMPPFGAPDSVWEEYCVRDTEIIAEAMTYHLSYIREHDLGSARLTIPSQAHAAFRHRFMEEPICVHHLPRYQEMERRGYYGGRCEAFFLGEVPASPVYYLDVSGMYASVLRDEAFPVRLLGEVKAPALRELSSLLRRHEVLAEVELETREPAFPYREDVVFFPTGRFTTVLPGPELRYALGKGYVRRVHWALVYKRGRPFRSYAEHFLEEKARFEAQGDKLGRRIAKLFLNSLYGKFAQRNPIYTVAPNVHMEPPGMDIIVDPLERRTSLRIVWGDKVFIQKGEQPSRWAFFPIAAWTTSYGRLRLWDYIQKAGEGHVFYCDTDGLIVDTEGLRRLKEDISPGTPGKLRVKEEAVECVIYGPKDYELDGHRHTKGVPSGAKELSFGVWQYRTILRTRTRLRKGLADQLLEELRVRRRKTPYRKGEVREDGWVSPLRLEE